METREANEGFASAGAPPSERADALVLFGATGDLARKKLFPALYDMAAEGRLDIPVIGIARSSWDDDEFRAHAREAIAATVSAPDPPSWTR